MFNLFTVSSLATYYHRQSSKQRPNIFANGQHFPSYLMWFIVYKRFLLAETEWDNVNKDFYWIRSLSVICHNVVCIFAPIFYL